MLINWFIMGYFVILFIERAQSLIRSFADPKVSVFGDGFSRYVNVICILSLVSFLVLLFTINQDFLRSLFVSDVSVDAKNLCITIGAILIAGMVHTEHTIPGIQFASYGLLIVAIVLCTINNSATANNSVLLWMSLVYLVLFSMAIPVVYKSNISHAALFHIIEAIVSLVLVASFIHLLFMVFTGNGENLFLVWPIALAVVGDAVVLLMRWKEEANTFVFIFLIASVLMWIAGFIVSMVAK